MLKRDLVVCKFEVLSLPVLCLTFDAPVGLRVDTSPDMISCLISGVSLNSIHRAESLFVSMLVIRFVASATKICPCLPLAKLLRATACNLVLALAFASEPQVP